MLKKVYGLIRMRSEPARIFRMWRHGLRLTDASMPYWPRRSIRRAGPSIRRGAASYGTTDTFAWTSTKSRATRIAASWFCCRRGLSSRSSSCQVSFRLRRKSPTIPAILCLICLRNNLLKHNFIIQSWIFALKIITLIIILINY